MTVLDTLQAQQTATRAKLEALTTGEGGATRALSAEEATTFDALAAELRAWDDRVDAELVAEAKRAAQGEQLRTLGLAGTTPPGPTDGQGQQRAGGTGAAYIIDEPKTYDLGSGHSYFRDLALGTTYNRNAESLARLNRHRIEFDVDYAAAKKRSFRAANSDPRASEIRALSRVDGNGGFFVPPAWWVDKFIALARADRPFANGCNDDLELPPGTDTINLPKLATGTSTAPQTADNATISQTDITDTFVSSPVITIAGQAPVALQLIEQSPVNFDQVLIADLSADAATKVNIQVLSGTGLNGQAKGVLTSTLTNSVVYTDAAPTVPKLYSKLADAQQRIWSTLFRSPNAWYMTPTRWAWFLAAVDANNRPFVVATTQGPYNALGSAGDMLPEGGPVGTLLGLPVFLDPSIPKNLGAGTNQDVIIAARMNELWLMEGMLRSRALEQTLAQSLGVLLQAYEYLSFQAERYPQAISVIGGTGLVQPTF